MGDQPGALTSFTERQASKCIDERLQSLCLMDVSATLLARRCWCLCQGVPCALREPSVPSLRGTGQRGVPCALREPSVPSLRGTGQRVHCHQPCRTALSPPLETTHPCPSAGGAGSPVQDRPSSQTRAASDLFPEPQDHAWHEGRAAAC